LEEKHKATRKVLKQLVGADLYLTITTKSALVTRDIDLLRQMKNTIDA